MGGVWESLLNPPRSRNGTHSDHGGRWRGGQTARQRARLRACAQPRLRTNTVFARAQGRGCTWWAKDLLEGAAVEDLEASGGANREAALVLVKSNVEHLVCRRSRQIYPARPHECAEKKNGRLKKICAPAAQGASGPQLHGANAGRGRGRCGAGRSALMTARRQLATVDPPRAPTVDL
jgi:hypothetical protein